MKSEGVKKTNCSKFIRSDWRASTELDLHLAGFVSLMFDNCPGSEWHCVDEPYENKNLQEIMSDFFPVYAFTIHPKKYGLDYCGIHDVSSVVIEIGYTSNFNYDLEGFVNAPSVNIFHQIAQGSLLAVVRTNRKSRDYIIGTAWQTNLSEWKLLDWQAYWQE